MALSLNLEPNREFAVIHLNQYEYGTHNTRTVAIYDGDVPFEIPEDSDVTIEGVKPDGYAFAYIDGVTYSGNEITFEIKEQMTVVAGLFHVEIVIRSSKGRWSTKNLIFDVEAGPINENTPVSDGEVPAYIDIAHRNAMKAVTSSEAAVEAAANAKTSETNAKSSETKAKTSETNAKSSETKAKTSETNAKSSETKAKTSETNAATSETNAKESELIAKAAADDVRPIITETGAVVETENARAEKLFYLKANLQQKSSGGYTSVTFTRTGIGGANSKTYKVNFPSVAGTVTSGTLEVNANGTATLVAGGETYVITDVPVIEMLDDYNKIQANITGTIEVSYRNNSKLNDYLDAMRGVSYDEITQAGTVTETGKMVVDAVQLNPNVAGTIAKRLGQVETVASAAIPKADISRATDVASTGSKVVDAYELNSSKSGTIAKKIADNTTALGGFSFGTTEDGKPGYKAPGADSVVPFSSGGGAELLGMYYGTPTVNVVNTIVEDVDLSKYTHILVIEDPIQSVYAYQTTLYKVGTEHSAQIYHSRTENTDNTFRFTAVIDVSADDSVADITMTRTTSDTLTGLTVKVYGVGGSNSSPTPASALKSGELLLLAIGSTGAQFYWSYYGTYYTNGYMRWDNLDFSNVKNFTFQVTTNVNENGVLEVAVGGVQIMSAAGGTCNINGQTGVTLRVYARNTNQGGAAGIRTLKILSYTDMSGGIHDLTV